MKDESKCSKDLLCKFKVIRDLPDALIEVCVSCGKKVCYNKAKDGTVDNSKYLRDHLRDTLQPYGRTKELFYKIYGTAPIKKANEVIKDRKPVDGRTPDELRRDVLNRIKRQYI